MYNTQHCNKNPIYVFPEKELHSLSPNFHIHVSDLYIPMIDHILSCSRIGIPIVGIYKSRTDIWMWKLGLSPPFLGIFVSKFRYCLFAVKDTGIEPRTIPTLALTVPEARCHPRNYYFKKNQLLLTRIPIPSRVDLIDTGNEGRARDSRLPPPHPPGDLFLTDKPDESR
jgi:hypothetical protein